MNIHIVYGVLILMAFIFGGIVGFECGKVAMVDLIKKILEVKELEDKE